MCLKYLFYICHLRTSPFKTLFCFTRFGRRIPYASFMITGGVAGMLVLAVPSDEGS